VGRPFAGGQLVPVLDAFAVPRMGPGCPKKCPPRVRVDKAYGARKPRKLIQRRGIQCVCPEREDARKHRLKRGSRGGSPPSFNPSDYKGRNVVKRAINRLKDFRAVATRYDTRGYNYLRMKMRQDDRTQTTCRKTLGQIREAGVKQNTRIAIFHQCAALPALEQRRRPRTRTGRTIATIQRHAVRVGGAKKSYVHVRA